MASLGVHERLMCFIWPLRTFQENWCCVPVQCLHPSPCSPEKHNQKLTVETYELNRIYTLCQPTEHLATHHPHVLHIRLVAQDHPLNIFICVLVWLQIMKVKSLKLTYVLEPLGDIVKALGIGDVIHQHNTCPKDTLCPVKIPQIIINLWMCVH